ncbi:carboxymuconolactone decarboxylase family protein [Kitasatospora sp. DSM 101779]|uniref:carboxymuconolactone decarboxylase family protein n=1 Tax=Kitasatospora sp. DSM 101779 TaxID=2853165 RepID=UPI0021DA601D|nr:carboxymuconolactone decarboxylase family protein [Kitasatospora sp. DSM 101779]MCU7820475.1 carboxymuconolactone decarboxylase family protein [Kitasatospora sp. DSM 101779]
MADHDDEQRQDAAEREREEQRYAAALDTAERLLGMRLEQFLDRGPGEPANGADFKRLATVHTFGDSWPRTGVLDTRTRALVSVTIAATLGTLEPLRGQLRIALNSGVTPEEIVEVFVHLEAYAGAARAFDSYRIALQVFAERAQADGGRGVG